MNFVDLDTALTATGLRALVAASVPSPWSQAALAIFHLKKLPVVTARTRTVDPTFKCWGGAKNLPAILMDDEPVRTGWAEILALAERLTPDPPLIPDDPKERIRVMGLCHEIMSEGALLWSARLLGIDAGMSTDGREGFPKWAAAHLAPRYGWKKVSIKTAHQRAIEALMLLDTELNHTPGHYYSNDVVTALDLYSAAAINALVPLTESDCPIEPPFRAAFAWIGSMLGDAITPALIAHRNLVVTRFFKLPIEL